MGIPFGLKFKNRKLQMKLTKENYEFLMFELLEGNLNESEKNVLMQEINKDAFYQREWSLMQHSVLDYDNNVVFTDKRSLLKPEGRIIGFISFNAFAKIAASLLLVGTVGWWYYTYNNEPTIVYKPETNINVTPEVKSAETPTANNLKQIGSENRRTTGMVKTGKGTLTKILLTNEDFNKDSLLPVTLPEILFIKPLENEGIAYSIIPNQVIPSGTITIEKPKAKEQNKIVQTLVQADKIKNTLRSYWNDIPNLKLKVTPKLKERNIGFELTGETIYANAIVEIK